MSDQVTLPVGVQIRPDIEYRPDRPKPYKARVRWTDPATKKRPSTSESFDTEDEATAWVGRMERAAAQGIDPLTATMSLADYGDVNMDRRRVQPLDGEEHLGRARPGHGTSRP